jgi:protein-S-isoprenylcysteine O-methyltransferase Ste14
MSLGVRSGLAIAGLASAMGLLLFAAAGTVRWWQAWVYLAVYLGGSSLVTIRLLRDDRELLERRMIGGPIAETRPVEKLIMLCVSASFVALLVVPARAFRLGRSDIPLAGVLAGDALVAIGLYLVDRVFRENTFAASTIQVAPGQSVISTGPYAIVRHPMYASASLYLIGMPLALGSSRGFIPLALMAPFLLWRLFDEERVLTSELPGYAEYMQRVPRRLIPFLW